MADVIIPDTVEEFVENSPRLNMKQIKEAIKLNFEYQKMTEREGDAPMPLFIVSRPGTGKTAMIKEFVDELGYGLYVLNFGTIVKDKFVGIPALKQDMGDIEAQWAKSVVVSGVEKAKKEQEKKVIKRIENYLLGLAKEGKIKMSEDEIKRKAEKAVLEEDPAVTGNPEYDKVIEQFLDQNRVVVFFDDLHLADEEVQKVLMELLTERAVDNYKLPKGTLFLTAGNYSPEAGAEEMISPVVGRLQFIVRDESESALLKDFMDYVSAKGLTGQFSRKGLLFLNLYPEILTAPERRGVPVANYRNIKMFLTSLKNIEDKVENRELDQETANSLIKAYVNSIAPGYVDRFMEFYQTAATISLEELFEKPKNIEAKFENILHRIRVIQSEYGKQAKNKLTSDFMAMLIRMEVRYEYMVAVNKFYSDIINPNLPVEKKYESFVQNVVQPMLNFMGNISKFTEMAVKKGVFNGEVREILNFLDSALRSEITTEYINLLGNFNAFYFYGTRHSIKSKDIKNVVDFVRYVAKHYEEFAKNLIPGFEPDIEIQPVDEEDILNFKKFNYVMFTPLLKEYVSPGEVLINMKKGIKDPQKLIEESTASIYHFFVAQGSIAVLLVRVNYYDQDETIKRVKLNNYKFRR